VERETEASELIGCADLIRGWPSPSTVLTRLWKLRCGTGRKLIRCGWRWWTNADVVPFWRKMGFSETGETKPYTYDKLVSESIILTKSLGASAR
jgi:hypothetical protein